MQFHLIACGSVQQTHIGSDNYMLFQDPDWSVTGSELADLEQCDLGS